jgi:GNAT superfamily N-acetyltransferase
MPIDIDANFSHCIEFSRDAYFCNVGTYDNYENDVVAYEDRIRQAAIENNCYYYHIWCGDELIGQLEFSTTSDLPETGYVHLIYVVAKYRGLGVSMLAQGFIIETLITKNCVSAILSVSRLNKRAIKHFKRFGWQYLKPNPKDEVTDFYLCQLRT